jgi:hypothetical protein
MPEKLPQFEEGKFLKEKYWEQEEFRQIVEKTSKKKKRLERTPISFKPEEQIPLYLERLKGIVEKKGRLFREISLSPKLIIQPENITDNYIKNVLLGNFAELKGYDREKLNNPELRDQIIKLFEQETGKDYTTYQVPQEEKEQIIEQTIVDQKASLDRWFEYLTGPEAEHYPDAFKYWAFVEMTKLGVLDPVHKKFTKRTKRTIVPFPELHQQALALVLDEIEKKHLGQPSHLQLDQKQQKELQARLQSENFGKLYAWALEYVHSLKLPEERLYITQGE